MKCLGIFSSFRRPGYFVKLFLNLLQVITGHFINIHMTKFLQKALRCLIFCLAIPAFYSCFLKQDRTTTVYGTITDENGQPVDSIMVILQGVKGFNYVTLAEVFSDSKGSYELVVDVPKKFGSSNTVIPAEGKNRKFAKKYTGAGIKKNGQSTGNCCFTDIGSKTRYDFELMSK